MVEDCYVPSPICYVNDEQHIGHACTTVHADFLIRYGCMQIKRVFPLAETAEHAKRVRDASLKKDIRPKTHEWWGRALGPSPQRQPQDGEESVDSDDPVRIGR